MFRLQNLTNTFLNLPSRSVQQTAQGLKRLQGFLSQVLSVLRIAVRLRWVPSTAWKPQTECAAPVATDDFSSVIPQKSHQWNLVKSCQVMSSPWLWENLSLVRFLFFSIVLSKFSMPTTSAHTFICTTSITKLPRLTCPENPWVERTAWIVKSGYYHQLSIKSCKTVIFTCNWYMCMCTCVYAYVCVWACSARPHIKPCAAYMYEITMLIQEDPNYLLI